MSEPLTKRLIYNLSTKKNKITPQTTANFKTKKNKIQKLNKSKHKSRQVIKKDINIKIKVKRRHNIIMDNTNIMKNSYFSYNNNDKSKDLVFLLDKDNNNDNEDKFNKEAHMDNEKYSKDSDYYPKTFYINNYNNNYINISNITIENNDKTKNQEKENNIKNDNNSKNENNENIKKSLSDKNLLNKKSLEEDIIISDDKTENKNQDSLEDKSFEFYSKDKKSNLTRLLSSPKNNQSAYDSLNNINNIDIRKKSKFKKRKINISLNYKNRNELNNIYSNKKFYYHKNKSFFRESKSVKNVLLDLRKAEIFKETYEKMNNSVTFRKNKKNILKIKESTLNVDRIKRSKKIILYKTKKDKNIIDEKIIKNKIKSKSKDKMNNIIQNKNKEKKSTKSIKNPDKLNNITRITKDKKNILNNKFNKIETKSRDKSNNKNKSNKINTHSKQFSIPLALPLSNKSKKTKIKEYPNMVKKSPKSIIIDKSIKKIKNINVICKVGNSGSFQKKLNQDNYFIAKNFLGYSDYYFLGVCDGHGIFGQNISSYLKEHLPKNVQKILLDKNITDLSNINTRIFSELIESIYKTTNSKMNSDERIDSSLSGSTCISGIYTPSRFFCINVGDSRCVLFKYFKSENIWTFSDLSRDHKPSDINEKNRILSHGGKVEPYIDEQGNHLGPERVWAIGAEDKARIPGLAMSRSFGDQVAHSVGVVVSPEILEHNFREEDKIILLASDGIWEFIENEEVLNIVKKYYDINDTEGALEEIYREADKRWRENEGSVDDITAIILFLE